nr:MAG TPA: hypothetical protein [Caudoviricetes sp.]
MNLTGNNFHNYGNIANYFMHHPEICYYTREEVGTL